MSVTRVGWVPGNGEHDPLTNISVSSSVWHMCAFKVVFRLPRIVTCVALPRVCQKSHVVSDFRGVPIRSGTLLREQPQLVFYFIWHESRVENTQQTDSHTREDNCVSKFFMSLEVEAEGGVEDIMQEGGGLGGQLRRCVRGIGGERWRIGAIRWLPRVNVGWAGWIGERNQSRKTWPECCHVFIPIHDLALCCLIWRGDTLGVVKIIRGHRPTPFECIETTWSILMITPVLSVCLIWDTGNTDRLERGGNNWRSQTNTI